MATKKDVCENNKSFAYYSWWWGIELKFIEYWIEDYIYRIDNAWYPSKWQRYHKSKITYGDRPYFKYDRMKIYLDECIKM